MKAINLNRATPKAKYLILTRILPYMKASEVIAANSEIFSVCDQT
jgi:hypothetical protein